MSKKTISSIILFIVFSVISFVVPFNKNAGFFIAYVFGIISLLYEYYACKVAFEKGSDARSAFYGAPIARVGLIYLVIQMCFSILSMIIFKVKSDAPLWIFIVINIIMLAAAILGLMTVETVRDEIVRQDAKIKAEISAMRNLQSLSSSIVLQCNNSAIKSSLQKVADKFKYSDPVSNSETISIENELNDCLVSLQKEVVDNNEEAVDTMCKNILIKLADRNRLCKLNK